MSLLKKILPVKGCHVVPKDAEDYYCTVIDCAEDTVTLKGKDGKTLTKKISEIRPLFANGMHVTDVPVSRIRKSLGNGVVESMRQIGGSYQVLIDFKELGKIIWVPYENLRLINHIERKFYTKTTFNAEDSEKVRLKNLAHAIELWNENTGALTHLDIDPLPHQIHLVHKILSSSSMNWIIADDVGLGKTIEVGMLIKALLTKRLLRRVLIVCPGGLTRQWQSELKNRFKIADFEILGVDFHINDKEHWKKRDFVIASIDKIKRNEHLESISDAGYWDLIIFDEAHRLTRRQYGKKFDSSDRFKVAAELRKYTDKMILATATPHQGEPSKFQALLEIIRPELKSQITNLRNNYNILNQLIIRNDKSKVTDNEGKLIFKGKSTHLVNVPASSLEKDFDACLQKYLTEGYNISINNGNTARAIGFVMTIYRKLASSSMMAIRNALAKRINKLDNANKIPSVTIDEKEELAAELNDEEALSNFEGSQEFFNGEMELLQDLIDKANKIIKSEDNKMEQFVSTILNKILNHNNDEKVLIFTEYRSTQEYIQNALTDRFGQDKVAILNGSMGHLDRLRAIEGFNNNLQFLVSTEAGGEGINLQRNCHIIVNFDLPWNPMRLVQRIGRIYRYGQQKKVIVFNIQSEQTFDSYIVSVLYKRITSICEDLSTVSGFDGNLEDEILGILSDNFDVEDIISKNKDYKSSRTEDEVFEAIKKAKEAVDKQKDIFKSFAAYDPEEFKDEIKLEKTHIKSFVFAMLRIMNIPYRQNDRNKKVYFIDLNEELANEYKKTKLKISFCKDLFDKEGIELIDYNSYLLQYLINSAKQASFHDGVACLKLPNKTISTAVLRWQNDQGMRQREEFISLSINKNNKAIINDSSFTEWLLEENKNNFVHEISVDRNEVKEMLSIMKCEIESRLSRLENNSHFPENYEYTTISWG